MSKLTVVSLNMWHGGRLWEPLVEFIREQSADMYFFQEAHNRPEPHLPSCFRTVAALQELFPDYYFSFAPQFGNLTQAYGMVPLGCLLVSRWPLAASETIFFDVLYSEHDDEHSTEQDWVQYPAILQSAQVTLPTGPIIWLGNLHGPVWYAGNENTPRRQHMVHSLCSFASQHHHWIVAGDSNAQATNPVWQPLHHHGQSVFGTTLKSTFNMRQKSDPGYATAAVDTCWVSPSITVTTCSCPDRDVSDHLPLVMELEVPPSPDESNIKRDVVSGDNSSK